MKSYDLICKGLDLAKQSQELLEQSITVCKDGVGQEVFGLLSAEGKSQVELIEQISAELAKGKDFAGACTLDEGGDDSPAERVALQAIAARYDQPGACQTELTQARAAQDMVEAQLGFYKQWAGQAQDAVEKEFVERMTGELRGMILTLADLRAYYEDPAGWAMEQGNLELDGA